MPIAVKQKPSECRPVDMSRGLARGLQAFYPLVPASGIMAFDASPFRRNAVRVNALPASIGYHGRAAAFSGAADDVFADADFDSDDIVQNASFSLAVLVATTDTTGLMSICGWKGASTELRFGHDNSTPKRLAAQVNDGTNSILLRSASGVAMTDGVDRLFVLTMNPSIAKLYCDGALCDSDATSLPDPTDVNLSGFKIGGAGASTAWIGRIGFCAAWNRDLNAAEIAALAADPFSLTRQQQEGRGRS